MKKQVLLLLIFLLLASVSHAVNLDIKAINGTEFTLISNTDQCLSNCEAWIEWDLTQGILSNVQIPSIKTSQFKFDIIKETIRTNNLTDFGVEVWKEIGTVIQDYRNEEEGYVIALGDLRGVDLNTQSLTCESFHCTEKEKDVCNCTRTISVPNGSHTDYEWRKVSDNFYGFEAEKGEIYRLRVWGTRDAKIGSNAVDWIPTFFGERIKEWDWWDSDWDTKYKLTITAAEDYNSNTWINLQSLDFSTLSSACVDGADITVVNEAVGGGEVTDLNFQGWDGTITDSDVNILFKITDAFVADTYETYYIYSNNSGCAVNGNRTIYESAYDGFEDGDSTNNGFWWTVEGAATETQEGGAAAKNGSFGTKLAMNADHIVMKTQGFFDSLQVDKPPYKICYWLKIADASITNAYIYTRGGGQATGWFGITADDFAANVGGGATYTGWTATPADNTWYKLCMDFPKTGNITYDIYDASEVFIESYSSAAIRTGALESVEISAAAAGLNTVYVDDVSITFPRKSIYVLGAEETSTVTDLNFTTINGLSYKTHPIFAYGLDGNITIDFNVQVGDNNRISIDLNYSPSVVEGSGTVIVKDLNLVESICPDQNFVTVSQCSYSWDYSDAIDGNYAIIGTILGGDFNASDGNFQIANDVNLQINIPIDEATGVIIDVSTYSFIVKVLQGGIETTYTNNTDINFFSIPISEEIIIIVDTNVDAYYWGREYYFLYETAVASDTLQPYLAPLGSSVLTTVHTVSMATLTAIPDMRIKIYKDLPGGRTLINDSVTDGKGETAVAFVIADNYEIEVWDGLELLYLENYVATATTNNHYIYLPLGGGVDFPTIPNISIRYLPALRERFSKDFNIEVIIASNNGSISAARVNIFNNGINLFDTGLDTLISADGNTYTINVNDLPGLDITYALDANVTVWLIDGTTITSREDSWRVFFLTDNNNAAIWLLTNGMRKDFGCSYGTDINLGTTCQPLFVISIFIIFFAIGGLALNQFRNGTALAIMAIIMTSFFVYITWIPFVWGVLMAVLGIVIIITTSRVDM